MNKRLAGLMIGIWAAACVRGASAAPEKRVVAPREHPRQTEILRRDARERRALKELYEKKDITKAQYEEIMDQLKTVVREDHAESKGDGGYITKQQQENMNRLLTAIRREAKADESADKLAGWLEAHPRQAEVLRRDWAEEGRVDRLYAEGKITAKQRDQILAELRKVVQEDHADAKANHGLTPEEQAALNRQENAVNGQIGKDVVVDRQVLTRWLAAHPRQAEVLRRDWAEEGRVDRLFADGKITAQQRDLILAELRKVAQDDHADAKASHGLTPEEQADLNRMENKINGQVSGDVKSDAAWADAHPRQAEVLRRDRFEQDRIKALVASGQISEAQGQAVLAELKDVALEDYADAKANGGNITKSEQSVMNQQENEINKTITTDKQ